MVTSLIGVKNHMGRASFNLYIETGEEGGTISFSGSARPNITGERFWILLLSVFMLLAIKASFS